MVAEALSEHLDVTLDETICQDLAAEKDESLAVELLLEVEWKNVSGRGRIGLYIGLHYSTGLPTAAFKKDGQREKH